MYAKYIRILIARLILRPWTVLAVLFFFTLLCFYFSAKLKSRGDLMALLPDHFESVVNLKKTDEHFGGISHLFAVIYAEDVVDAQAFVDTMSQEVAKLPSVSYVISKKPIEYFKDRIPLYLELEDLREIEHRVTRSLVNSRKGGSVVFSNLLDFTDPEDSASLDLSDIEAKYRRKVEKLLGKKPSESPPQDSSEKPSKSIEDKPNINPQNEGYYYSPEDKLFVVWVKSTTSFLNLDASEKLVREVQHAMDDINHQQFGGRIKFDFTGDYKTLVDQNKYLKSQVIKVSVIVFLLLTLVLTLFYGDLASSFLIGLPLAAACLWAGGATYLLFGHINLVTGFTGAILLGLGSDYGIFLLSRYKSERASGKSIQKALEITFALTGRATLSSCLINLAGFLALVGSEFRGFFEFGVVGFIGMASSFIAMLVVMPCLFIIAERFNLMSWGKVKLGKIRWFGNFSWLAKTVHYPKTCLLLGLAFLIYSGVVLPKMLTIRFDSGDIENREITSSKLEEKVLKIIDQPLRPPVVLAASLEQEQLIVTTLKKKMKETKESHLLNDIISLDKFVPEQQVEKKVVVASTAKKFKQLKIPIRDRDRDFLSNLEKIQDIPLITRENLPNSVRKFFFPMKEGMGVYSAIYLFPGVGLGNERGLKEFTRALRGIELENKTQISASGDSFIASDILFLVEKEGPRAMVLIFILLAFVLVLDFNSLRGILLVFFPMISVLPLLAGLMKLVGLNLNILNVCMIPIIFATGVDSFIHYFHHYEEGPKSMEEVSNSILPPIFMANFTSLLGFGGFALASHSSLRSVGWLAILGTTMIFVVVSLIFPAWIKLVDGGRHGNSI